MPKTIVSGIVKHNDGIGFKITFETAEQAQKYKDMFIWILESDDLHVETVNAHYDKEKE